MTRAIGTFSGPGRRAASAILAVMFWAVAALIAGAGHLVIDQISLLGGTAVSAAGILVSAWCYMRLGAHEPTVDHAVTIGAAWLLMTIATEMVMTVVMGRHWFVLLGNPEHGVLRTLFLFIWVGAPALFAQYTKFTGEAW
jgi:hypothetical protein